MSCIILWSKQIFLGKKFDSGVVLCYSKLDHAELNGNYPGLPVRETSFPQRTSQSNVFRHSLLPGKDFNRYSYFSIDSNVVRSDNLFRHWPDHHRGLVLHILCNGLSDCAMCRLLGLPNVKYIWKGGNICSALTNSHDAYNTVRWLVRKLKEHSILDKLVPIFVTDQIRTRSSHCEWVR